VATAEKGTFHMATIVETTADWSEIEVPEGMIVMNCGEHFVQVQRVDKIDPDVEEGTGMQEGQVALSLARSEQFNPEGGNVLAQGENGELLVYPRP